ncbi:hypothetical protein ElyMa_007056500 [Elysia marginata]|uniref:Endoplasmic reticulum transmembrane protein n=1 Tax=Elysia marginata TaxID=1093978 RepID=A0AAV4JWS0_9GAST|nr:hypothetical protein ElyMa_007056500 [Elysia marginata]
MVNREYAADVESFTNADNICETSNQKYKSYLGPQLFLEILFLKIRGVSFEHSSAKRKHKEDETKALETEIKNLEASIEANEMEQPKDKKDVLENIGKNI